MKNSDFHSKFYIYLLYIILLERLFTNAACALLSTCDVFFFIFSYIFFVHFMLGHNWRERQIYNVLLFSFINFLSECSKWTIFILVGMVSHQHRHSDKKKEREEDKKNEKKNTWPTHFMPCEQRTPFVMLMMARNSEPQRKNGSERRRVKEERSD